MVSAVTEPGGPGRAAWQALPDGLRRAAEYVTGPVAWAAPVPRRMTPCPAFLVEGHDRQRFFVKAGQAGSTAYPGLDRERLANLRMPRAVPAPTLRMPIWAGNWAGLVFDAADGRDADLSPGSPDVPRILALLRTLCRIPAWEGLPPAVGQVTELAKRARELPLVAQAPYADALARFHPGSLTGGQAVHFDISPDNVRVGAAGRVLAVDWEAACAGAAWIDAVIFAVALIMAGHSPAAAERAARTLPDYENAPADSITGLTAILTLNCEHAARYGPEPNSLTRARAAEAGRSFLTYRSETAD